MPKSQKPEQAGESVEIDDDTFFTNLGYAFFYTLLENLRLTDPLAFEICVRAQKDGLRIPELETEFPKARRGYREKRRKALARRRPLQKEKKTLAREKELLENADDEARDRRLAVLQDIITLDRKLDAIRLPSSPKLRYADAKRVSVLEEDWAILQDFFREKAKPFDPDKAPSLYRNFQELCTYLKIGEKEQKILTALLCLEESFWFETVVNSLSADETKPFLSIMAKMTGMSRSDVSNMFRMESSLVLNGLVDISDDIPNGIPRIDEGLLSVLSESDITLGQILRRLVGEPVSTTLDWHEDFAHLGEPGVQLFKILGGVKKRRESGHAEKGINILLYGPPDTGKTEAVKALCQSLGLTLYAVGENDGGDGEPSRLERLSSARLAQSLLEQNPGAVLLFDEMEDLLAPPSRDISDIFSFPSENPPSKIFLNRMLEGNETITVWIANDVGRFHEAVLRRMTFSIEFGVPPAKVREKLWTRISAKHDFDLAAADARRLSETYVTPPGVIDTAVRNAARSGEGTRTLEFSTTASAQLLKRNREGFTVSERMPEGYDLRILNMKREERPVDVIDFSGELARSPHRDFSLLLFGPPGTGKSAYARYLGEVLEMDVMLRRASDLFRPHHGETEQKIARMFSEARDLGALLVLDEGDSFLQDRNKLAHSWEIPMVNEMLTGMERHPLPFVLTTNLAEGLDPASKRRFTFKIFCDYLRPDQLGHTFRTFFDQEPPTGLEWETLLTPGDFAVVRKQLRFRADRPTPEELLEILRHEVAQKPDAKKMRGIGFVQESPGVNGGPQIGLLNRKDTPEPR